MHIIDMHTHTFPDKIAAKALEKLSKLSGTVYYTNGTEEGLKQSMTNAGINYSVILPVATSKEQVESINNTVIEMAPKRLEEGIISFAAMHPDYENPEKELARIAEAGVCGIKLHPAYTATDFDDDRFVRILQAAAKNNLAVTVHAGIDIGIPEKDYCSTQMILKVIDKIPGLSLILAHMGGWKCWDKVRSDLVSAPLLFDTSFSFGSIDNRPDRDPASIPSLMTNEEFTDLCHELGTEKILFGTDSPWADQKMSVERFLALPLEQEEKEQILHTNAKKILRL